MFRFRRIPIHRDDENKYVEFLAMKRPLAPPVEQTHSATTENPEAVTSTGDLAAFSGYQHSEEGSSSYAAPV